MKCKIGNPTNMKFNGEDKTMFKNTIYGFLVSIYFLAASVSTAQAVEKNCMPIGGLGMPNFVPEKDGSSGDTRLNSV